jgi:HD-GYP domain-containing protein (c-di-GMP phosphodiesterase class II)
MRVRSLIGPVIAILIPYLLFESLRLGFLHDGLYKMPQGHFYIVSSVAILATVIAIAVGIAGNRLRNIQISFLSLAFISLAELFAIHGLSTPNFLMHASHLTGISASLSILLASFWLWLSSVPSDHKIVVYLSRWQNVLVPAWTILLFIFGVAGILFPNLVDFVPLYENPLKGFVGAITLLLNVMAIYRYYQSYRFSRYPLQIHIIYSACWFIVAEGIMIVAELWKLSWWLYHFLLLASMISMIIGLIRQNSGNKSIVMALKALFTTDPIERITSCLSPSVKALILATETRDSYTSGHNLRVTMYALKLAAELHIHPEQLRALAQGTIVHDVGKINVPDSILNKQGSLTSEERSIIQLHPVKGYEMCKTLGFMMDELGIIRSHHERWDGTGYPDQLKGQDIPLLARIVAVVDVYDALTSNRSYRQAWSQQEVIQLLVDGKNSHFDEQCVEAWIRICDKEPAIYQNNWQDVAIHNN